MNKKNCTYKTNYITSDVHLKSENIVKYAQLLNHQKMLLLNIFDILCLPNEIICYIVELCGFREQILFSLLSIGTKSMFPELASHTSKTIEQHIASTYMNKELLLRDAKLFKIDTNIKSEFCDLVIANTPSYQIASHFTKSVSHFRILNICKNKNIDSVGSKILEDNKYSAYSFLYESLKYENLNYSCYLLSHNTFNDLSNLMDLSIKNGQIENMVLLLEKGGIVYDNNITKTIIDYNQLKCLKYFDKNGYILNDICLQYAVMSDYLHFVKYIFENIVPRYNTNVTNCPITQFCYIIAKQYRHKKCIEYFEEQGVRIK